MVIGKTTKKKIYFIKIIMILVEKKGVLFVHLSRSVVALKLKANGKGTLEECLS